MALVLSLIALAAIGRYLPYVIPQLGNFTPVFAVALFGGAYIRDRKMALIVPMLAMVISDALIGFHGLMWLVYGCMAITTWLGMGLTQHGARSASPAQILGRVLAGSVLFFIASNFAVWAGGTMYPHTPGGLLQCFVAAVPFWRNELIGSLLWSGVLFGGYALLQRRVGVAVAA